MTTLPALPRRLPVPRLLLALLLLSLLSACGPSPSDAVIQKALNRELRQAHLAGLLEVTAVGDVDRDHKGGSHYVVDVQYTLRARQTLSTYTKTVKNDPQRDTMDRFAMLMALAAVRQQFGDFKKGDTFKQQRRISLEKDQDGWYIPHKKPATPPRS